MEEYLLGVIKKNQPVNALTLCAIIARDKNHPFKRSELPSELLATLNKLLNDDRLTWTEEGISC